LSVSNYKKGKVFISMAFYLILFLKFETPRGIADLTASTALDAVRHFA
jgi:hypothetical protein